MTAKELTETSLIPPDRERQAFAQVVELIRLGRERAMTSVNTTLIDLHWQVSEFISQRIDTDGWGKGTVAALADYIRKHHPGVRGLSQQNLWRMRQPVEPCRDALELSTLLRELPWSSNLHILAKAKRPQEREFYLRMASQQRWSLPLTTQPSFQKAAGRNHIEYQRHIALSQKGTISDESSRVVETDDQKASPISTGASFCHPKAPAQFRLGWKEGSEVT